jgi:hypothetical protein
MKHSMTKAPKRASWTRTALALLALSNGMACRDADTSIAGAGKPDATKAQPEAGKSPSDAGNTELQASDSAPGEPQGRLADGIVGSACAAASDCGSGSCLQTIAIVNTAYPGGYCTGACRTDDACGANGVCVPGLRGSAGSCYRRCEEKTGCERDGYRCRVVSGVGRCVAAPPPLPDDVAGNACTSDSDCGGGAMSCASMLGSNPAPEGYCSQSCAVSADCGAGGICINGISIITISSGRCLKSCSAPDDCRTGYECRSFSGPSSAGPGACTPLPKGDAGTP